MTDDNNGRLKIITTYACIKPKTFLENLRKKCIQWTTDDAGGLDDTLTLTQTPGGGGVLPYMGYIGVCRGIGHGF